MLVNWQGSAASAGQRLISIWGCWRGKRGYIMEIPKIFWAYYDLYRRKKITLAEFSQKTKLSSSRIKRYIKEILEKA